MQILSGRRYGVNTLAFSHCGRWLAAGEDGGLHLWDTTKPTAKPFHPEHEHPQSITYFTFRRDGKLFFGDDTWKYFLTDPENFAPKQVGRITWPVAVSPDGRQFVRVEVRPQIKTWGFNKEGMLTPRATMRSKGHSVFCAGFSPDGKYLATVEGMRGGVDPWFVLRSAKSLSPKMLTTTYREASEVLFSPDSEKCLVRSAASFICLNVADRTQQPRKAVNPSRKHFLGMAFHPDGKLLTVDNERLVRVWDIATLTVVRTIEWNIGKLYAVAVSPDGTRAAVGSHTGKVLVWDWD